MTAIQRSASAANLNVHFHSLVVQDVSTGDGARLRAVRAAPWLRQAGVKYVILLEGINDIGLGSPDVTAEQITGGYRQLIEHASRSRSAIPPTRRTGGQD